jgi:alkylation response protein AidB-like acyl-CoA dehydrogenase
MEFNFTQEQSDLQQRIRNFCSREIFPGAGDLDAAGAEKSREMIRERLRALGRAGLLGSGLHEKGGPARGDLLSDVMLLQELGEACPATALSVLSSTGACGRALREWGGEAERDAFLKGLFSGEAIGAFADLEPGADLDGWALKTAASRSGSGFGVTGKKAMVLNGPVAVASVVTASADGGTGLFLVRLDGSGTGLSPLQAKLGCRGVPTAELILNDCPAVRLAPEGGEEPVVVLRGRVHLLFGAVAAGMVNAALVTAGVHAREHQAGDKPLARHQEISFKLAEMFVLNDTARMLLYRGLWRMEEKDPEAPVLASCAKVFASEAAVKSAQWALQITGEQGYRRGSRAERIFRDAKLLEILGDCTEKHRMFVADRVLAAY